jgi:hypothetical protein
MEDLQWRALKEIRRQPGCSTVGSIAINRVTDGHTVSNWSLCVVCAALTVQHALRRDYDLMAD